MTESIAVFWRNVLEMKMETVRRRKGSREGQYRIETSKVKTGQSKA